MISMKPYQEIKAEHNTVTRVFDESIDPIELMWHRDQEDRLVEAIEPTDWMMQLDNELPTLIDKPIFIPRYNWHRVIKGTGTLTVKITKL
jgi:hypothetical protein